MIRLDPFRHPSAGRLGVALGLAAVIACAAGTEPARHAPPSAPAPGTAGSVTAQDGTAHVFDTHGTPPPAPSGRIDPADAAESARRRATRAMPWSRGALPRFVVRAVDRDGSLRARDGRRAYEGAPPVMPHSEDFSGGRQTCLDCHSVGMTIGERVARPMSHHAMASCTQCHVEAENPFLPAAPEAANAFTPLRRSGAHDVAYEGAPPTIPHGLLLRQTCLSCHGEHGYPGLQTEHAGRASCTQCHAPSARFEPLHPAFRRRIR